MYYYNTGIEYSKYAQKVLKYMSNDINIFEKLLNYLISNNNFINLKINDLLKKKINKKIKYAIRCDVDCDIITAIKMSEILKKYKINSTFFILHTAYYFMKIDFEYKKKKRQEDLKNNILKINNEYCHIGLHIDPLHSYIKDNFNGAIIVENELKWLRKIVNIDSVSAHNSFSVYGAENFEIFNELCLNNRKVLNYDNKKIKLGVLSLKKLNVTEVNFPILHKKNIKKLEKYRKGRNYNYYKTIHKNKIFKHGYDINIWIIGYNEWLVSNNKDDYFGIINFEETIKYLDNLDFRKNYSIVFNLHPIYFSYNSA